jgi:hypothetical protein
MSDPYIYLLLHKYQKREYIRRAEQERLLLDTNRPVTRLRLTSLHKFSHMIVRWWTQHRQTAEDNRLADGKVVMP